MTEKKQAINISLIMIILSLITAFIFLPYNENDYSNLIFTLSTGVFGSSFATLWIFVYEYNKEKKRVLTSIFSEVYELMENSVLYSMKRFGFYSAGTKESMENKYYVSPVNADIVKGMNQEDKCLYYMSRFVDGVLDFGYDRVQKTISTIDQVDFWSDTFKIGMNLSKTIREKFSYPIYDVFVSAPAEEDGYIFRCFNEFKMEHSCDALSVYTIVEMLDQVMFESNSNDKYSWLKKSPNMRCYLYEKLWTFRDAFYSKHRSRKQRKQAMRAFLYDGFYPYIR